MKQFIVIGRDYNLTLDYENYFWELHNATGSLVVRARDTCDIVQAFAPGEWKRAYNVVDQLRVLVVPE